MFSGKRVEIPRRTSNLTEIDFEFVVIYVDRMSALYLSRCVNVEKKIFSFNILVISSCPTVDHYRLSVSSLVFFDDVYILFVFGIHFTGWSNVKVQRMVASMVVYFKEKRLAVGQGHNIQQTDKNLATKALESYKGNKKFSSERQEGDFYGNALFWCFQLFWLYEKSWFLPHLNIYRPSLKTFALDIFFDHI